MENYVGLGRTKIQSHYRAAVQSPPAGMVRPPLQDFDSSDIWPWITNWLKAAYQTDIESIFVPSDKKHPFEAYPPTGEQGHYDLSALGLLAADGSIRIALAGDWGTGTDVAQQVADNMIGSANPELTIHLGDIYYVGLGDEVQENCWGLNTGDYKGVFWRKGSKGSFALNGNHEMYSGGNGYFESFIPYLGIPASQDKVQLTSYFCLETPAWRIIAVDTGYNSDTLLGNCKLDQKLLDWLHNTINPVAHRKPTVLLSHHQWFSGFNDGNYGAPAKQISSYLANQEFIWLWGHEHRLAIYDRYSSQNPALTTYARCIGHGGMPNELPKGNYPNANTPQQVEYWDGDPARFTTLSDGTQTTRNGYVEMVIQNSVLTLEYFDFDGTSVLKESFSPGTGGGAVWDGTLVRTIVADPHILTR
jgi:hypothetical protein